MVSMHMCCAVGLLIACKYSMGSQHIFVYRLTVFQEAEDGWDHRRLLLRSYIIQRCSRYAASAYGDGNAEQVCHRHVDVVTVW